MSTNITSDFPASSRVPHMDCIFQVKFFSECRKIIGVCIHIIPVPSLRGAAVPPPIVSNDSVAPLAEEQHLSIPVVRCERPAVTENYGLSRAPVFVKNLGPVFGCNRRHLVFSLAAIFRYRSAPRSEEGLVMKFRLLC